MSKLKSIDLQQLHAIQNSRVAFEKSGKEMAVGKKVDVDTVSRILGKRLEMSSITNHTLMINLTKINALIETAGVSAENLEENLVQLQQILNQSDVPGENINDLNLSFQNTKMVLADIIKSTTFEGKKLLTGDLTGVSSIQKKYNTNAVTIKSSTQIPGFAGGAAPEGTSSTTDIQMNNVLVNDHCHVDNVQFTFVDGEPANENEVRRIAGDDNANARSLIVALTNSPDERLKKYTYSINNADTITITRIAHSTAPINTATGGGNIMLANSVPGTIPAISMRHITNVPEFLGKITNNPFTLEGSSTNQATTLALRGTIETNPLINGDGAGVLGNANDRGVKFSCKIGKETFIGGMFVAAGGNVNNYQLAMRSNSGQQFSINFGGAFAGLTSGGNAQAQGTVIAATINALLTGTDFSQNQYLNLDTLAGDIRTSSGTIGSTTGLTASLQTDNFKDLKFENITITQGNAANNTNFTATIGGKVYSATNVATATLVKGFQLVLAGSQPRDCLYINLGDRGLTSMDSAEKRTAVEDAFKKVFGLGKALSVRNAEEIDNTIDISIADLSMKKLLADDDGTAADDINILTADARTKAFRVIKNAIDKITTAITNLKNQSNLISSSYESLNSRMLIQTKLSEDYLDTDYLASSKQSQASSAAFQNTLISMRSGLQLNQAVQQYLSASAG